VASILSILDIPDQLCLVKGTPYNLYFQISLDNISINSYNLNHDEFCWVNDIIIFSILVFTVCSTLLIIK